MVKNLFFGLSWALLSGIQTDPVAAQGLSLKEAVQTALTNYGTIRAKANYVKASQANVRESRKEYLPDLNISAQNDYGTVNSQYGVLGSYKIAGVGSGGPVLASQNWSAAFGSLYLTNVNWDFFSFGRARERTKVAQTALTRDQRDLDQERFQQSVRVSGAYLNLLAAQKLTVSQQRNLERAQAFQTVVSARARSGLNPGVDSALANAEVSNAKIALTNAIESEQEQANQLAQYMGLPNPPSDFVLDSFFVSKIPGALNTAPTQALNNHPLLKFYQERVNLSNEQANYLKTFSYPTFSLFGVMQDRGSGFDYNYGAQFPNAYSGNFFKGVSFQRANYLLGVGMIWNLTSPLRIHEQVAAQQYTSQGLQEEYGLVNEQLQAQLVLSETRIKNALDNYREAPIGVKAASDAYLQKSVLYKNGLATIVDVTTALFELNRAETDRDIAFTNVWQALLFKAASGGDFGLFINEF
jgi:outer membrane protein TolC